jgi:cytochrome P450
MGRNPFGGSIRPTRVPLFFSPHRRPSLPFAHPLNYSEPIRILESYFCGADDEPGDGRHTRYLNVPGFYPILVTRDPSLIRAILAKSGDRAGAFDRDTLPTGGIARATGKDTLLYANGPLWKRQRRASTPPFGKTSLFLPERFHEFEATFRNTARKRLQALDKRLGATGESSIRVALEPEIQCVVLEMLVNNFFGAQVPEEEIRNRYVGAVQRVIDHIVRDTIFNRTGIPIRSWPSLTRGIARAKADHAEFEKLTDLSLAPRKQGSGLWKEFKSDAPDSALRSNIKVFLAGALEATTSYASWAVSHLARHPDIQEKVFQEVRDVEDYTPEKLDELKYLMQVLNETLRLTPALYFLPRRATAQTLVETADGRTLSIPLGTHIMLDIWHANRHEDHWGVESTGYPAHQYVPERWAEMAAKSRGSNDSLHFGFGHGPRFCPGRHLGQMEVCLVVGALVKLFKFKAVHAECGVNAGVSTKPSDKVMVELQRRDR